MSIQYVMIARQCHNSIRVTIPLLARMHLNYKVYIGSCGSREGRKDWCKYYVPKTVREVFAVSLSRVMPLSTGEFALAMQIISPVLSALTEKILK